MEGKIPYLNLLIVFFILSVMKMNQMSSLTTFFASERIVKLKHFEEAKLSIQKKDQDLLKLWESILTGRSAPLAKWMKERYKSLALNHIFTPSGFHLSAVLFPFLKIIPTSFHLLILIFIGFGLLFVPGFGALKRMVLIKGNQNVFGLHLGFYLAVLLDLFFGTFETNTLGFAYSFLFLSIIYSGFEGVKLILWFFFGQAVIALFQTQDISLLLLIFSPVLNFCFAIIMPLLFLLSYPLWNWQLSIGLFSLRCLQWLVDTCAGLSEKIPSVEIHIFTLMILLLVILWKKEWAICGIILFCSSLNMDLAKAPGLSKNEFAPIGRPIKVTLDRVYYADGICRVKLVRGFWWENCSPRKRSSRKT